jgi:hypothetical protein
MRRIGVIALGLGLLAAACSSAEETTTSATELAPTTTIAAPTTIAATTTIATTTQPPTTTTTQPPTTTTTRDVEELVEDIRAGLIDAVVADFEDTGSYDRVDVITFDGEGTFVIEGTLQWASEGRQENAHWESITSLAIFFGDQGREAIARLLGGDPPIVHLTTVSSNGDYRYQSRTDHETFVGIFNREVGIDGWRDAANAGFQ